MSEISEDFFGNQKIRLLEGFSDEEVKEFLSFGIPMEFHLHDTIIIEGQDDRCVYLILDGEVSIWKKNIQIFTSKKGDVFNFTTIFFPKANLVKVMAEAHTKIIKIKRREVLKFFSLKPERLFKIFMINAVSILLKRVDGYQDLLVNEYIQTHLIEA